MKAGWGQNTDTRSHVTLVLVVRGVLRNKLRKHEELFVTLIVQSQIFLETTPAQSHWVNLSWGRNVSTLSRWFAETTSPLPEHPFPLLPKILGVSLTLNQVKDCCQVRCAPTPSPDAVIA